MATQRRERKVVTVVFCDLVGFTAQAESMDPEDVEAILRPYHERVRSELERHGGTVEKFIGDAVMALFGAPTAHEDDPERAVRAALAIRDFAVEESLELRVGITTGEALVRLDAHPEAGEGMASGDVVNTAARLQSAAPVNEILADETTYRATRHVIHYESAAEVEAKGKAEPIPVWTAVAAHARFGVDVAHEARSELVGRERELAVLREAFERARHERAAQLLTLVGVPGIGKSRLVYELSRIVDADPELITWRQGRCLAYGDGVTLWALSEIVKAQAGIVEQDSESDVEHKLRDTVADVLAETGDASWVESELRSLVGLAGESELGGDRRGAAFSAWRRFLEAMAEQRPLIVVFEDLHWADESLLDFVDELVDWVTDVPLLVVATARPELLERRPGWGGGKLNATTLALAPLSDDQTARMIAQLLQRSVLAAESQQALLERAGGNPLYAEQFSELYLERGSADELPLPETLQGIIAARLDGLPETEKELLRNAAVVGKVFWAAALRREVDDAASTLHSLERKGFVRRQKRSSVEGESEFAFAHALVRDVAYGQIARADRVERHRQVAEWIESLGRTEDHAEMLAYHWRSALELAEASGLPTAELEENARLALREAGDRAFALNAYPAAERYYAEALGLWSDQDSGGPELLFRRAHALYFVGDERREEALLEARDASLSAGDTERAAEAEAFLAHVAWYRGQPERVRLHLDRATELAGGSPSAAKGRVLSISARTRTVSGEPETGMRIAEEALEMADSLGLDELRAHALATIGTAKTVLGDPTGIPDLERALEIAVEIDSPIAFAIVNNLAVAASHNGTLLRAEELFAESARLAERFGDGQGLRFCRGIMVWQGWLRGRWDDALETANGFVAECEAGSPHVQELYVRLNRGSIRMGRGDIDGALADYARALALARESKDPLALAAVAAVSAGSHAELRRWDDARRLVHELIPVIRARPEAAGWESMVAPYAEHLSVREELRAIVAKAPPSAWNDVSLLSLDLDFRGAAEIAAAMPNPPLEAWQRRSAGAQLIEAGRRAEGEVELQKALAFYRSVGATFFIQRAEALLAKSA
ncbi:MAG TPA: adenylate/guanylate cyclase domain-containing protein [Gaiellaceae bacterium]|nr:adenylate/guanylate cyclase domain-containing protein [Gaiellaceae bacterium]